jgi:hypothetical protein
MACPIPRELPVTIATLFSNRIDASSAHMRPSQPIKLLYASHIPNVYGFRSLVDPT